MKLKLIGLIFMLGSSCMNFLHSKDLSNDQQRLYENAYVFGFPLVLMHTTEMVMLKKAAGKYGHNMLNKFDHMKQFPDASFTDVVSPNADTLYSVVWISLKEGPLVLSVPNMKNIYYLLPMLDAWTNVFSVPGTRTTGNDSQKFLIVGPSQSVKAPKGVKIIRSPTDMVWLIGRVELKNSSEIKIVNQLQDEITLRPLNKNSSNQSLTASMKKFSIKKAPVAQVESMSAIEFFNLLASLMKDNPPAKADKEMIKQLKLLGIEAGKAFNVANLGPNAPSMLNNAKKQALARIKGLVPKMGTKVNGWQYNLDIGTYSTRYLKRAAVAYMGLGANLPVDSVYPITYTDYLGHPLDGKNKYILHFDKSQIPAVNAFWSLTLYNDKQFFVKNPINRYNVGSNTNLKYAKDGSLTIYIQNEKPGEKELSNWLPAPKGPFNLVLRLYWPKKSVLKQKWQPGRVMQVQN